LRANAPLKTEQKHNARGWKGGEHATLQEVGGEESENQNSLFPPHGTVHQPQGVREKGGVAF